ncbi:hypothetical protein [Micromonospora sp. U21]|uniref:hypothetical protein n=1 Tax=Micromonospora sp. U21 TaxID=2824899 RepID=UPI001FFCE973|nr:hypothetical protein [Micromonospora sp. U21]
MKPAVGAPPARTLLWFERCRAAGVAVPVTRFVVTSAVLAVTGTLAAVGALLLAS